MKGRLLGLLAGLLPLVTRAEPVATLPSALQVLEVLRLADTDPAALINGFEALGFHVIVEDDGGDTSAGLGIVSINLDLWQSDQPFAHASCLVFGPSDIATVAWGEETAFDQAAMQPFTGAIARRIVCSYDYWNPETLLTPFIAAAADWGHRQIGPMQTATGAYGLPMFNVVNPANIGTEVPWAMQVGLLAEGDEGHMSLAIVKDLHGPVN